MTTLILGASAGIGRALARLLAAKGHRLVLVARGADDLDAEARHLRLVHGAQVEWLAADAAAPAEILRILTGLRTGPPIRTLLFPIGLTHELDDGLLPAAALTALIDANLTSVMAVAGLFLPEMLASDVGNIVCFGSIAAIRGRGANIAYAAAKRGLESYFESLRHRLAATGVRVQFYRLGYVATQMSFGKALRLPSASPEWIAEQVVRNLGRDVPLRHLPRFWAGIGALTKALPWRVYRRLQF